MNMEYVKLVLLGSAAFVAVPAAAQQVRPDGGDSVEESGIADIIVTAQKRSESVQSVPLAITALSGDGLADRNITNMTGLATSVPNMSFGTYGGNARIAIRGVGFENVSIGHEGRVAYHLDGVYISRPSAILGTFYDVERVEVLRGPQGTLYGRNATGGSVNVVTRAPTDYWAGYLRVGYGNYNALTSEGALGGPISDGVRFRVAYTVEDHDGWGKNVFTGHDVDDARRRGARGTLSFDLGSSGRLDLSADYYREKDANYGNHYLGAGNPSITPSGFLFGGFVPANVRDISSDFDPVNDRESYGFAARAEYDLGGGATLKSISSYRRSKSSIKTEFDATNAALTEVYYIERARQLSQELQISGSTGRLKYIVGAYYFHEKDFGESYVPLNLLLFGGPDQFTQGYLADGDLKTDAAAAFGQLDYDITDQLTITIGGRYSWEKHSISDALQFDLTRPYPPRLPLVPNGYSRPHESTTASSFTPKFVIEYKPQKDLMVYASVSEGFKSGGFDPGGGAPPVKPETLWAYEGGMKGTFADGRVRINAAGFYYDYTNLQVSKSVFNTNILLNAASSVIYGAEAEITVIPVDGLQFDAAPAWLHTEYKDFSTANPADATQDPDQAGHQLPEAPKWSFRLGAEYSWAMANGRLKLRGEMNYQDRIYFTSFNEKQVSRAPNTKFNAFLTYEGDHLDVSLYGQNLTNKTTFAGALVGSSIALFPILGTLEPPRTYGIKVGYHF